MTAVCLGSAYPNYWRREQTLEHSNTLWPDEIETRRKCLKSALYLRLKKRKGFLKIQFVAKYQNNLKGDPLEAFKKIEKFFGKIFEKKTKNRFLKQSHSAKKLERGDPLGFLKLQFAAKYQKTSRGDPLATKNFESRTVPEKNSKGDPIVSSGFVYYVKKGVN